ncbi:MAG TPA: MarR family winged helix-turn-helix transcriptional regulator [Candidatus Limnocylindrales bacterium]|nr:MarR family winged helix-turn-helix transcriptional regulator [Candidatus Limnocylindrales bacterium]
MGSLRMYPSHGMCLRLGMGRMRWYSASYEPAMLAPSIHWFGNQAGPPPSANAPISSHSRWPPALKNLKRPWSPARHEPPALDDQEMSLRRYPAGASAPIRRFRRIPRGCVPSLPPHSEPTMSLFLPVLTRARNRLAHGVADHIVDTWLSADESLLMWLTIVEPELTAALIRRRLGLRQSTFTSMVARLVGRGYLRTKPCERDRRTRYLVPTLPGFVASKIARSIHLELEGFARPQDPGEILGGLVRLSATIDRLPVVEKLDDGSPAVTA